MSEPVRDSRGVEITEGARVAFCGDPGYLVVGPDPCPEHEGRVVVIKTGGDMLEPRPLGTPPAKLRSYRASDLTVIPDTVRVTVELPRDEYEALRECPSPDEFVPNPNVRTRAHARFRAAVRDHPGSQEQGDG